MAWQQSDLDALDTAIASNVLSVRYADGRQTTYQNATDMLAVRTAMKNELAATAGRATPPLRTTVGRIIRW